MKVFLDSLSCSSLVQTSYNKLSLKCGSSSRVLTYSRFHLHIVTMMTNFFTLINTLLCFIGYAEGVRRIKHNLNEPSLPSLMTDFPDPAIIRTGDTWWAYATNSNGSNIQLASATKEGFDGKWKRHVGYDVLPKLPPWVLQNRSDVWAPSVVQTVSFSPT